MLPMSSLPGSPDSSMEPSGSKEQIENLSFNTPLSFYHQGDSVRWGYNFLRSPDKSAPEWKLECTSASPKPQLNPSCCARRSDPTWKSWRGVLPWDWRPLLSVAKATPEWPEMVPASSQPWIEWVKRHVRLYQLPHPHSATAGCFLPCSSSPVSLQLSSPISRRKHPPRPH